MLGHPKLRTIISQNSTQNMPARTCHLQSPISTRKSTANLMRLRALKCRCPIVHRWFKNTALPSLVAAVFDCHRALARICRQMLAPGARSDGHLGTNLVPRWVGAPRKEFGMVNDWSSQDPRQEKLPTSHSTIWLRRSCM